ncbi:SET domain-containing protein [Aureococcus anophagefferens]|nr:SET domain-containing protein [Aureococcus anophagefferens]
MAALVETTTQSLDSVTMAALLDTSKAADATDATDMSGVRVERSPLHGRGLFAARDFAAGETILVEAPLVAMQDLANRHAALVCGECLAFLDLGRDLLEAVAAGASPRVAADAAVARGGGPVTPEWLARIVGTFEQNNVGVRLRHPLDDDDDDEAEDDDDDDDDEDEAEDGAPWRGRPDAAARFEAGALPTFVLLRDGDELARVEGADERRCARSSRRWLPAADDGDADDARRPTPTTATAPTTAAAAPRHAALEGTALYSTICCANHACDQSCDVLYAAPSEPGGEPGPGRFGAPLRASLVARRAVAAGDELTIAYVDTDAPWQERRALADSRFLCRCSRCVAEMRCPKCA